MKRKVSEWKDPPAMEVGAPMPSARRKDGRLWVAYVCQNPDFQGWNSGAPIDHPGFDDYSAVLEFDGVEKAFIGWPNDEDLHKHPLYSEGLSCYGFYEVEGTPELTKYPNCRHWIVTFHDETLEVIARNAKVVARRVEGEDTDAIVRSLSVDGSSKL